MKKSELIEVIKEIMRPMIHEELNKVLLEIVTNKQSINESTIQKPLRSATQIKNNSSIKKQYTSNPILNNILNETIVTDDDIEIMQEVNNPHLKPAPLSKPKKQPPVVDFKQKYAGIMESMSNEISADVDEFANLPENNLPDFANRDYSQIVERF